MDCIHKNDVLLAYCAGRLGGTHAAEIAGHVAECADCRRTVEAQGEVWRALDRFTTPEVAADFDARLYARIAQEESEPFWRRWARRIFQPAVPVAMWKPAVSVAAAAAVLAIGLAVRTPSDPVPQVRAEHAVDIETVANALDDLEMLTPSSAM